MFLYSYRLWKVNSSEKLDKTGAAAREADFWCCGHVYRSLIYGKTKWRTHILTWISPSLTSLSRSVCSPLSLHVPGASGWLLVLGKSRRPTGPFCWTTSCFSARRMWKHQHSLFPPRGSWPPPTIPAGLLGQMPGHSSSRLLCLLWGKKTFHQDNW